MRVRGEITSQELNPVGRLVPLNPHFDSGEKSAEFLVPSSSRPDRVYRIVLDVASTSISCLCEDAEFRARANKTRLNSGTYLENLVKAKTDFMMEPSILRPKRGLCKHCRKVQIYLKRHKELWLLLKEVERIQILRFESHQRKASA